MFCSHQVVPNCNVSACTVPEACAVSGLHTPNQQCKCIRPYFPSISTHEPCVAASEVVGAPVIPIMVVIALANIYSIAYAIWIVYRKKGLCIGTSQCCKCNYVITGAVILALHDAARLVALATNRYLVLSSRVGFIFTSLSYMLLLLAICFVFLSFHTVVTSLRSKPANREETGHCDCTTISVILLTAVQLFSGVVRTVLITLFSLIGDGTYDTMINMVVNTVHAVGFLVMVSLMTVQACRLQRTLRQLSAVASSMQITKIDNLICVLNRYFYPTMVVGTLNLLFVVAYSFCFSDLGAWSYILSWTTMDGGHIAITLLMLCTLEGNAVPLFPRQVCCRDHVSSNHTQEMPQTHNTSAGDSTKAVVVTEQ